MTDICRSSKRGGGEWIKSIIREGRLTIVRRYLAQEVLVRVTFTGRSSGYYLLKFRDLSSSASVIVTPLVLVDQGNEKGIVSAMPMSNPLSAQSGLAV